MTLEPSGSLYFGTFQPPFENPKVTMDAFSNKTAISEGRETALDCQVRKRSGSPDLKDHLPFSSDLALSLLSLSVRGSLLPLKGASNLEGHSLPYTLN